MRVGREAALLMIIMSDAEADNVSYQYNVSMFENELVKRSPTQH